MYSLSQKVWLRWLTSRRVLGRRNDNSVARDDLNRLNQKITDRNYLKIPSISKSLYNSHTGHEYQVVSSFDLNKPAFLFKKK